MKADRFIATGILALFLVTGSGNAFAAPSGAVAQGNISVFKGGQLAEKLTGQNPVEDEALLVCDGKCMIKAPGISLIGADGARLAIKKEQEQFNLLVNKGRVDFVINDSISKVAFYTSGGQYTVADIMFNASTNTPVRGYMQVADDGAVEIGVFEGRMVFSTAEGAKTVDSNNRLLLAMSEGVGKDAANNASSEAIKEHTGKEAAVKERNEAIISDGDKTLVYAKVAAGGAAAAGLIWIGSKNGDNVRNASNGQ